MLLMPCGLLHVASDREEQLNRADDLLEVTSQHNFTRDCISLLVVTELAENSAFHLIYEHHPNHSLHHLLFSW